MVSFDLWVHIYVEPPVAGWKVQLYWRSPDPWLEPPWNWVGPTTMYTDATGEAFFDVSITYTSPEYYPIPILIVIPEQEYPGPIDHTYGGLNFEGYDSPEWEATGESHFRKYVTIHPRGGKSADVLVRGKVLGGYPPPDMTLNILINGSSVASRTILGASIGTPYDLAGLLDTPGLHQVKGEMLLSNPLGSRTYSTDEVSTEILSETIATKDIIANWCANVNADQDPDSTIRDRGDIDMYLRRKTYHNWGLIRVPLSGIFGITGATFYAYCYEDSGIDSGENTYLYSTQPFPNSFLKRDDPDTIAFLGGAYADAGRWFVNSDPALLSYLQSREGDQAYFMLYCIKLSGDHNYMRYYTKDGPVGYRPFLRLNYLKYS